LLSGFGVLDAVELPTTEECVSIFTAPFLVLMLPGANPKALGCIEGVGSDIKGG
jgi:hypothetical protein